MMVALITVFFWYRSASQPQIDGKLQLAGPGAAIDIVRDAQGVPHIYAQSAADAYFGLGFAHAQDRLWQMELNRRIPAGTMAEILGPGAADTDRFLRTLGVQRNAEAILQNLAPDARAALDAYAKGVNAYLANRKGPLPPEFLLAGAPAPAPWQPVDSIGWQTMMAWDLGANWTQELLRMRLAQRLPLERINQFMPPYPGDAPLPTQDYTKLYRQLAGTAQQLEKVAAIAPPSYIDGMGSNNWVVDGARTESGKPLLANDPHLGLSAPALWYFAHLSAPGLNVIGATLPGLPAVVLGRNDRIAWGFTNTGPDVQDLFIERVNPANPKQYQTPDGWADFKIRSEIIKVKGQPDVTLEVRESRHGPIITGALPFADRAPVDAKTHVIAFAWTALRPDDLTLQAGVRMNHANNWQDFLASARDFASPQQNMVYADIDGNIGFIAPGRVPIRKAENDLHGLAPAPGWDARYDWAGFIPFESLPHEFNPASHQVITANEKIVEPDYPYFLTSEWHLPYRADRIAELMAATPKHSLDSFGAIQKDVLSLAAREVLPLLLRTQPASERAKSALAALSKWDGTMGVAQSEPLILNAWLRELSRRMFADELGESMMQDFWSLRNMQQPLTDILKNPQQLGAWCGDARQPLPAEQALPLCAKLLSDSLEATLDDLQRRYGDPRKWRWGDAHEARSEHRPFGKVPLLAKVFDVRVPSPGDNYTVDVGRYNLSDEKEPFTNRHAPSLRALYDLDDPEKSRFIHSTGQSGNLLSPLYRNFSQRWAEVTYLPMQMRRPSVRSHLILFS
ncbi:MAG TPA: penicillin acylase family protein [Burkholderiaceae bacterium]|nr:penicillin acylase family protein [Burkholderiaceae bacterium]